MITRERKKIFPKSASTNSLRTFSRVYFSPGRDAFILTPPSFRFFAFSRKIASSRHQSVLGGGAVSISMPRSPFFSTRFFLANASYASPIKVEGGKVRHLRVDGRNERKKGPKGRRGVRFSIANRVLLRSSIERWKLLVEILERADESWRR